MAQVRHIPAGKGGWKAFDAQDATHDALVDLSEANDSSARWLHRREETEHRPLPSQSGLYRMAPGTFEIDSPGDQTSYVLEGRARVELDDGTVLELGPGDMAFYPVGTHMRWTVVEPFTEFFTMIG